MVVLSVVLLTRQGKGLIARQFVEMTRMRLEGLIAAFPKLLGTESRQHTFIDTESVRYVYTPLDTFFILLITNKTSNLVQDLETLALLAKVIPDVVGHVTEESLTNKQFELIFAFDEILTAGGHAENITVAQIRTNMEMESHEEKLHNMILQSKQDAAKSEAKRQQARIKTENRERLRMERVLGSVPQSMGSTSGYGNTSASFSAPVPIAAPTPVVRAAPVVKSSGMKLGGGKKDSSFVNAMVAEDNLSEIPPAAVMTTSSAPAPPVQEFLEPIVIATEEKMSVVMTRDGTLESLEVKGSLYVSANDLTLGRCRLHLAYTNANGINFQCHPKVNKSMFEKESILGLKDASKPFPSSRVGVLRWNLKTQEESFLPLNITCWPEDEGNGKFLVNLEYTMERSMELQDVRILVPIGHDSPDVHSIDGEYRHDASTGHLLWHHATIDSSNNAGTLEFSVHAPDIDTFFPIQIAFFSQSTYGDVAVTAVLGIDDAAPVSYAATQQIVTDSYQIQ